NFFFSSKRRHTRFSRDWSSDVCSSDLHRVAAKPGYQERYERERGRTPGSGIHRPAEERIADGTSEPAGSPATITLRARSSATLRQRYPKRIRIHLGELVDHAALPEHTDRITDNGRLIEVMRSKQDR